MNILHVLRSPVGGLFRHVVDLTRGQSARGHRVGMVVSNRTGGPRADAVLAELEPQLALGLSRVPMWRQMTPADALGVLHLARRMSATNADVVHGHGAKGGAFARLAPGRALRAYTPHGGSLLFSHDNLAGKLYLTLEKLLKPRGDLYLFESAYSARMFRQKIGDPGGKSRIVHNGVSEPEFEPIKSSLEARDVIFMGELRELKGIDVLIDALALLRSRDRHVTATIVGDGPDAVVIKARAAPLGDAVRFLPPMPARQAQALGRIMAVPSRLESFPYVVLEAAAAGVPLIATNVGGIPEIFGPLAGRLIPPNDPPALANALVAALDDPEGAARAAAELRARVRANFSLDAMVDGVLAAYASAR